ncbi:MAG: radical SAM protein [Desulfobacterales bacterium]|nr:radical SAM protein [Desulfobacterales bacterium]
MTAPAWSASCAAAAALGPFTACVSRAWAQEDVSGTRFQGRRPEAGLEMVPGGIRLPEPGRKAGCLPDLPQPLRALPGDRSVCRSKVNVDGKLYSLAYGNPCAVHIDPIEKKPLYHFAPRSNVLLARRRRLQLPLPELPELGDLPGQAPRGAAPRALPGRGRPAARSRPAAIPSPTPTPSRSPSTNTCWTRPRPPATPACAIVLISNGYINREPLIDLCRVLDAANINLKAYSDAIYRKLNGGRLAPVLATLKTLHDQGVHLEITNLVVPTYVDDEDLVRRMCAWILKEVGPDHPLHFLRFQPLYKLDRLPPTPVSTLARFREIALAEGIRYAYVGNVPNHEGNHTYCHQLPQAADRTRRLFHPRVSSQREPMRILRHCHPWCLGVGLEAGSSKLGVGNWELMALALLDFLNPEPRDLSGYERTLDYKGTG